MGMKENRSGSVEESQGLHSSSQEDISVEQSLCIKEGRKNAGINESEAERHFLEALEGICGILFTDLASKNLFKSGGGWPPRTPKSLQKQNKLGVMVPPSPHACSRRGSCMMRV